MMPKTRCRSQLDFDPPVECAGDYCPKVQLFRVGVCETLTFGVEPDRIVSLDPCGSLDSRLEENSEHRRQPELISGSSLHG